MRMPVQKRSNMQNGSLIKANRRNGREVWEFRWRDRTSGKAVYRRIVLGSAQQFPTEIEARAAAAGIVLEINVNDPRVQTHALTMSQLAEHYRHRELSPDNTWKSYSTKKGYENYLKRWIVPKWGEFALCKIKPIEVELWLRQLPLARSSCAKIKNIMSVLFNHARRYKLFDDNPIHLVRQSAKRRRIPLILLVDENPAASDRCGSIAPHLDLYGRDDRPSAERAVWAPMEGSGLRRWADERGAIGGPGSHQQL
jgi:hypothetical protein